jgi:hypothetical protein
MQATLLNLLLRNYLEFNLYEQADTLIRKTTFPEGDASNNQVMRACIHRAFSYCHLWGACACLFSRLQYSALEACRHMSACHCHVKYALLVSNVFMASRFLPIQPKYFYVKVATVFLPEFNKINSELLDTKFSFATARTDFVSLTVGTLSLLHGSREGSAARIHGCVPEFAAGRTESTAAERSRI